MKTLAVNGLRLTGPRTAMGRYLELMLHYWSRSRSAFDRIELCIPDGAEWPGDNHVGTATEVVVRRASAMPLVIWEQGWLAAATRAAAALFCPAYVAPLIRSRRTVVANHGIYEALPYEFSTSRRLRTVPLFRASARRADRVIANSECTRRDLVRYFSIREDRIDVVYPAAAEIFFETSRDAASHVAERVFGNSIPFILFVGNLSRRRHVPELIAAFAGARERGKLPHKLLIVGPDHDRIDVAGIARRCGVSGDILYLPLLEQSALALMYAACDLFVLPTTYEGTSWTILEAMASGAPVLTVQHPQLADSAGDAAFVVERPEAELLAAAMIRLLQDPAALAELSRRGRERASRFSWADAARATLSIAERVAFQ